MNKKFLILGLVGFLLVGVVMAIGYYSLFSSSFHISSAITTEGELSQELGLVFSGETIYGDSINIINHAPTERQITLSNDGGSDIETTYVSELELTQKNVDFTQNVWTNKADGKQATVRFTINGNQFNAEVTGGQLEGYELIYYKDNSDRFNSPAKAIKVNEVSGNLPYEDDKNADEYNYCLTEEYDTCHGAKIWYVPSSAILPDGSLDWSMASDFLFETELVQYNTDSEYTIYGESNLIITPVYHVSDYAPEGDYTITTTVA